ncbi:hemolysin family protein [Sporichthya sp.]|uniref:hemolysin family protein n=1 Tax=Sporichthya sp. TaxID=65475 RepID=UPI00182704F5|nr:hemolysin family protein [Sporichthya sp.]MBA3743192.1 HlyC/CorC family transporter [Sporichthya sp.]
MDSPVLGASGVCALLLFGGLLTLAQAALFSLREDNLRVLAERGPRGRRVAVLAARPERVSQTVRVGTVLSAVSAAALGATTLAEDLSPELVDAGMQRDWARFTATALVVLVVAFVALALAELVPFRLAPHRAEVYALALAGTLNRFAVLIAPVRWLLPLASGRRAALAAGEPAPAHEAISSDELREMVSAHAALTQDERKLIGEVFSVGEVVLREVMVPRTEVDFIDAALPLHAAIDFVLSRPHSRYPVVRGSHDDVVGFVNIRDLLDPMLSDQQTTVGDLAREISAFPATNRVLPVLSALRASRSHLAVVVDEYGGTAGIITVEDLVEELVGEIQDEYDPVPDPTQELPGGDLEVDGLLNLEDFAEVSGLRLEDGPYETVAGFLVARLGHIARVGDLVAVEGRDLEVCALDGRRVARVRVTRSAGADDGESVGDGLQE